MSNDDLDTLANAGPVDEGELVISRKEKHIRQPLKPGEIPDFTQMRHDRETGHTIESTVHSPSYVTASGHLLDADKQYAGMCYVAVSGTAEPVNGCGVLVRKRECAAPNCDRLLCPHHSHAHPAQEGLFLCEEHYREVVRERVVKTLGAFIYWAFVVLVPVLLALLAIFWLALPALGVLGVTLFSLLCPLPLD